jgi:hypothetical protein
MCAPRIYIRLGVGGKDVTLGAPIIFYLWFTVLTMKLRVVYVCDIKSCHKYNFNLTLFTPAIIQI